MRSTIFRLFRSFEFRTLAPLVLAVAAVLFLASCNTPIFNRRTVYVRPGQTMVLRETLKNVKVYVLIDGKWEESDVATLPEGAYITYKRTDRETE